jgi:hypothetical protein
MNLPSGMTLNSPSSAPAQTGGASSAGLPSGMTLNATPAPAATSTQPGLSGLVPGMGGDFRASSNELLGNIWGGLKTAGKFLTTSEQNFGNDITGALSNVLPGSVTGLSNANQAAALHAKNIQDTANIIKQKQALGEDTTQWTQNLQDEIKNAPPGWADLYPSINKSAGQVLGDAGGVALDIASAGSYGEAVKGAETGSLLTDAGRKSAIAAAADTASQVAKPTLSSTLGTIAKQTAVHSITGGALGYGFDVSNNAQQGKTGLSVLKPGLGTAAGIITPALIGGVRAGVAITADQAPKFINSLINPSKANFAYGKNPGRTVAELGITGNSLSDFEDNITAAKKSVGSQLGTIYNAPKNSGIKLDLTSEVAKLDTAIADAASGGKNNQNIVTQLTNIKSGLLFEHGVDDSGQIVQTGTTPRDVSALSPAEAQGLIQQVSGQTRFTGSPSDDKKVNSVLQDIYGGIRTSLNTALSPTNPDITKLNQQYGDLTSAELATRNREAIVQKQGMINPKVTGAATAGAIITAVSTGGAAIPAILVGATSGALEKAMETTAVKTRIAAWLGSESPTAISGLMKNNPAVASVLRNVFPKIMSQFGTGNTSAQ